MPSLEDMAPEARDELALLARRLAENPATRKEFLRLTKKATPDLPIPELEIEDTVYAATNQAHARVEQLEQKLREKEAMEELNRRRQSLVKKGKVSDESEIEQVEKIMLERGITNHETAADFHKWMNEQAKPTPSTFSRNVLDDTARNTLSSFWKNPQHAARDEASKALMELRRNPRPIGL
jgi:cell envelope opacity-associated protein A